MISYDHLDFLYRTKVNQENKLEEAERAYKNMTWNVETVDADQAYAKLEIKSLQEKVNLTTMIIRAYVSEHQRGI